MITQRVLPCGREGGLQIAALTDRRNWHHGSVFASILACHVSPIDEDGLGRDPASFRGYQ